MRIFIALCTCALLASALAAQNQSGRQRVGDPPIVPRGVVHATYDFDWAQSFEQMVKKADVIVAGRVESIFPSRLRQVNDPGSVETDTLFAVDRVLKGKPELLRSLVIVQPGGKYVDLEVLVDDYTPLKSGDRHILFLHYDRRTIVPTYPRTDGTFSIVGGWSGNFKVEGNAVMWLAPSDAQTFKKFESGTADDFIAQILAEVAAAH
jgi:hypothetical protein